MSIKKIMVLMGLSVLFAGCSTGRLADDSMQFSGSTDSATNTGIHYLLGRGVPQDDKKAFSYFQQGARNDDPFAQNEIAYMYAAGKGTPRDYTKAVIYYQKAAEHGLASAQYNLGLMYLHGLGTPANKSAAMIWFKKSAAHGFLPAREQLEQLR